MTRLKLAAWSAIDLHDSYEGASQAAAGGPKTRNANAQHIHYIYEQLISHFNSSKRLKPVEKRA
jgi:hypothetical protein